MKLIFNENLVEKKRLVGFVNSAENSFTNSLTNAFFNLRRLIDATVAMGPTNFKHQQQTLREIIYIQTLTKIDNVTHP